MARFGIIISFRISFKPSATGCNKPKKPTILGPDRRCIAPITLRSANVKKATATNKKITRIIKEIIIRTVLKKEKLLKIWELCVILNKEGVLKVVNKTYDLLKLRYSGKIAP